MPAASPGILKLNHDPIITDRQKGQVKGWFAFGQVTEGEIRHTSSPNPRPWSLDSSTDKSVD